MIVLVVVKEAIEKLQVQSKPLQNLEMPKDKCLCIQTRNRSEESYPQYNYNGINTTNSQPLDTFFGPSK